LPKAIDDLVLGALSLEIDARPETARKLASELARIIEPASPDQVLEWVRLTAGDALKERRARVRVIESQPGEQSAMSADANADPYAITQPASPSLSPNPSALALSLPSSPPPAPTLERRRSALPWLALVGAVAIIASSAYAFVSLRKDLDASEAGPVEEPSSAPPVSSMTPPSVDSSLLSAEPLPSVWPTSKRTAGSRTRTVTKKPRPAHCNPPYVVLGDGRKVTKLGCD
jgi:hypothetical protein